MINLQHKFASQLLPRHLSSGNVELSINFLFRAERDTFPTMVQMLQNNPHYGGVSMLPNSEST
jgi:hypothetical protein